MPVIGCRPTSWTTSTSSSTSRPADQPHGPHGADPFSARLGAVGLVHPFPSALVAISTGAIGVIAGGSPAEAITLTLAMAGFQASIGAVNDLRDRDDDAIGQPWKAIPSGRVSQSQARLVAVAGLLVGVAGSVALGPATVLVGLLGYGLGVAYDLWLKRTGWGWLCFAIALPLVPVYAWLGVGAGLPPSVPRLFALGGLAGLELAIANGLVDAPADLGLGGRGVAVRLGPTRARTVMVVAALGTLAIAWLTLLGGDPGSLGQVGPGLAAMALGSLLLVGGVAMSLRRSAAWTRRGWQAQALGVAIVAIAWVGATG
jgi:4-hydroxybenzoate polyprenyltransferase